MDLEKMLRKCQRGQWKVDDMPWEGTPRLMSRKDEVAIVQYFTDMAAIERLAGALFAEQRRIVEDNTLRKIFATFVADEERHAVCAERLAAYYNVHKFKKYKPSPELVRFQPHFLEAIQHVSPEVANLYITCGELMLDIALLRSLNDYVDDEMSNQAMKRINQDESRHIAVDYHMMAYYASEDYQAKVRAQPRRPRREHIRAAWAVGNMLLHARPFLMAVFLNPMTVLDPQNVRMREAFKRIQLFSTKPEIVSRPLPRFLNTMRRAYNFPVVGRVFGSGIARLAGAPGDYLVDLFDESEALLASQMTMDQMAQEALASKLVN